MEDNRGFVLHNMINADFAIGDLALNWYALQQTHVQKLLVYWQRKKISSATIMNSPWSLLQKISRIQSSKF